MGQLVFLITIHGGAQLFEVTGHQCMIRPHRSGSTCHFRFSNFGLKFEKRSSFTRTTLNRLSTTLISAHVPRRTLTPQSSIIDLYCTTKSCQHNVDDVYLSRRTQRRRGVICDDRFIDNLIHVYWKSQICIVFGATTFSCLVVIATFSDCRWCYLT